ncbi:hypothetical protein DPMN_082073 [Dreissena polymorpha]|uniref:Uncharacterized protein n=1 Tax=Dreissena polymorpha TaxID=45954 RepID=A0A9D3Y684_DREPO|nr:hypothetical protein DPMN_082073 [Dreissena polymorpha]
MCSSMRYTCMPNIKFLSSILQTDGRTDGLTDRQTDGLTDISYANDDDDGDKNDDDDHDAAAATPPPSMLLLLMMMLIMFNITTAFEHRCRTTTICLSLFADGCCTGSHL